MKQELRIRKRDALNWVIERWHPAGIVERGPYAGQTREAGWDETNPVGYFPTLKSAAVHALDEILSDDGLTGKAIAAAITEAEDRIRAMVEAAGIEQPKAPAQPPSMLALTDEQKEEIRNATDPVHTFLCFTGGKRFKRTYDETRANLSPKDALLQRLA